MPRAKAKPTKRTRSLSAPEGRPSAFEDLTDVPCPMCLRLIHAQRMQLRAVMPLPVFPGRSRQTNEQICRDCQATESMMAMGFQHPEFGAARLTVANERLEALVMPPGMAKHFGMCRSGFLRPCSINDLPQHSAWLERHGIPDSCDFEPLVTEDAQ